MNRMLARSFLLTLGLPTLLLASCAATAHASDVTDPEAFLGRQPGADFQLADWSEVSGYFRGLAEQSPRVELRKVGTTTEGRDFLLAVISSEENLARLDELQELSRQVADPRGLDAAARARVLSEAKVTLFISCAMHATETAAPQLAMEIAHQLATSDQEPFVSARENMVVLIAPTLNPDGLDHVVSWYRETVGTPFEGSRLTKLYQYYTGHDNNRDWFGLTQAETRLVTRLLYSEWFPQVYWDVHQQGQGRERLFVPPYRDPLNPNLDPAIIAGIDALGSRALLDLTKEGFTGVSTGVTYDMWWNGGNRNVPVRHNIIGLLTEAASVNFASPVFIPHDELEAPRGLGAYAPSNRFPAPWPGGWWRLRDIIDMELAFGRSLLGSLAREPRTWLENAMGASQRAMKQGQEGTPRAWIIPSDNPNRGAVRRLVDTLLIGGVEVHVSDGEVAADGRRWPANSIVIQRNQPYGAHVKDLFEIQRYPEGEPPYDVAGWTLPLLMGVHRVDVVGPMEAMPRLVHTADEAVAGFPGRSSDTDWDASDSDTWLKVFETLGRDEPVHFGTTGEAAGRFRSGSTPEEGGWLSVESLPRIGVYSPWSGSMDEGWMRWLLDTYGVPYISVRNEMMRAGKLSELVDVLLIPSIRGRQLDRGRSQGSVPERFAGGLAPEGAIAVEEFVRTGGTLVTLAQSSTWAQKLLDLPLSDVTSDPKTAGDFSCPGSVVRSIPEDHPLTAGLGPSVNLFFSGSAAWSLGAAKSSRSTGGAKKTGDEAKPQVLLRYAPRHTLLSGWIRKPDVIAGQAAWVLARHGEGRVHLFGFRPHYRGWTQATFPLLFRALLLPEPEQD